MKKISKHILVQVHIPADRDFEYLKELILKNANLISEIEMGLALIKEEDKIFVFNLRTDDTQYVGILLKHIKNMLGYDCCNYHEATLYTNISYIKNGIKVKETKSEIIENTIGKDAIIKKKETNAITLKDWNNKLKSVIEILSDLDEDYSVDIMVMDEPNGCLVQEVEFDIDICHPIQYVTIYIRYKEE